MKIVEAKSETKKSGFGVIDKIHKLNTFLATIFLIIWIAIGAFVIINVMASLRQGLVQGTKGEQTPQSTPAEKQNVHLPGVGMVNINCIKESVSQESLQKIIKDGNTNGLTQEEKTQLEPCIVENEAAPSPTNQ